MRWASAISEAADLDQAISELVTTVRLELGGERPDLAVVFASPLYGGDLDRLPGLLADLSPRCLLGSTAGGVIGAGKEIEGTVGISLTAGVLPGVRVEEFQVGPQDVPAPGADRSEWLEMLDAESAPSEGLILLADPFSFDVDRCLTGLYEQFPTVPVIGGLASGARQAGEALLFGCNDVWSSGAVGVSLRGNIRLDTLVAQGCRPIGSPMFVTRAEGNMIQELDGESPYELVRNLYQSLPRNDQELLQTSLFLGVVMDPDREAYRHGDFLIRNVLGFDREHGSLAVGAIVQPTQVVQFHLRDARTSHDDLDLHLRADQLRYPDEPPAGALLFSCLGRGEHLYGQRNHDSALALQRLGQMPLGGFFCNGEIGPVQGRAYLHGYTSAFALFRPKQLRPRP